MKGAVCGPVGTHRAPIGTLCEGWMDELGFYVPSTVFQSFRDDGRVNMKGSVQWSYSERISPPAGFEPVTPWSEVGSANRSATRTLLYAKGALCGSIMILECYHRNIFSSEFSNKSLFVGIYPMARASRLSYSLPYSWPPKSDLLLRNSLLELLNFLRYEKRMCLIMGVWQWI